MNFKPQDASVLTLGNQFIEEQKAGTISDVEQFACRFPERREELLNFLPKLLELDDYFQGESSSGPRVPKEIGKYKVGRELGRGGMGIVCSAIDCSLGSEVALKLLPVEKFEKQSGLRRFDLEAKTNASLDHPNIVPVYDFGLAEGFAFFAMKRIHGRSLSELIFPNAGPEYREELCYQQISAIGLQAAEALEYAHGCGVIHRDIKPGNMLLDDDGKLWLTDFGLAKLTGQEDNWRELATELTETGELVGTVRYMAPERFRGVCSEVSDIFGLGLTLYELVIGKRVFSQLEELVSPEQSSLPDLREVCPDIPDSLCRIIMKACHFDPKERYQTAGELR